MLCTQGGQGFESPRLHQPVTTRVSAVAPLQNPPEKQLLTLSAQVGSVDILQLAPGG